MYKYKQVLEFKFDQLPDRVQREMRSHLGFGFDRILSFRSMYSSVLPERDTKLDGFVARETLVKLHEHHVSTYDFSGDLMEFVEDENLLFFKWIIDEGFPLPHIDDIYIDTTI